MPKLRAYGADAILLVCRETTYGTAPTGGYRSLDFKSTDLSSEQPPCSDPCGRTLPAPGCCCTTS